MTVRKVRFTGTARQQLHEAKKWWRENRAHQEVLSEDIDEALFVIARLPGVGAPYSHPSIPDLRRIYLRRVDSHLYYTVTDREILIRALWHTSRRSGPRLLP